MLFFSQVKRQEVFVAINVEVKIGNYRDVHEARMAWGVSFNKNFGPHVTIGTRPMDQEEKRLMG